MLQRTRNVWRRDTAATDPILVIAAIAVSLVLLVGGSFTVSGMIANAKNVNARSDLDKVATAEAALVAGNPDGGYLSWAVTADGATSGSTTTDGKHLNDGLLGFTTTPGVALKVVGNSKAWVAGALAQSGTSFWRSSTTSKTYTGTIPASAYDPSLTLPDLTSTAAPVNSAADCPHVTQPDGSVPGVFYDDPRVQWTATAAGNTVTVTLTAPGDVFCLWAQEAGVNIDGDTYTAPSDETAFFYAFKGYEDGYVTGLSPFHWNSGTMSLVSAGPTLSATRTVTTIVNLSADDLQNADITAAQVAANFQTVGGMLVTPSPDGKTTFGFETGVPQNL